MRRCIYPQFCGREWCDCDPVGPDAGEEADMNTDKQSIKRRAEQKARVDSIAAANKRVQAWTDGRYEELPNGYTHESLWFEADLRLMGEATEVLCGILWLAAEKL